MFFRTSRTAQTTRQPARQTGRQTGRQLARRLSLENLERREVMAGSVLASVVSGELRITGDDAANGVVVSRVNDSTIEVRGITVNSVDTRINGTANGRVTFNNVTRNVVVDMRGGNDQVRFHGTDAQRLLKLPGAVKIDTQGGNDEIFLQHVKVAGDLSINSGSGSDTLAGAGLQVGASLFVREATNSFVKGDWDSVNLYDNSVIGNQLNVKLNAGDDSLKVSKTTAQSFWIEGNAGNDRFVFDGVTTRSDLIVKPGKGSDTTSVFNSNIGDDLFIEDVVDALATDQNSMTIQDTTITDGVYVTGGVGVDMLAVRRSKINNLDVKLAAGKDSLNIIGTTVRNSVKLDGGTGADTINRAKNNKTLSAGGFETATSYDWL